MKSGKVSEAVLKRSIINLVNKQTTQRPVSKAAVGCDAGIVACEEITGMLATSCTTLSGCEEGLATIALLRACNSLAASGGNPAAVTMQLMLPEAAEEKELKEIMQEILTGCGKADVALVNGHTQVGSFVTEPVFSVTVMGPAPAVTTLEETVCGSDLVMTKSAGFAGAALLAKHYRENLHERYTYAFIDKAADRVAEVSVLQEIKVVKELGIRHMHDVAEGGVFGAVWEFCERLNAGVELDLKKIPICQDTVEICEYFDVNPYQLKGDGALLFLTHDSGAVIRALNDAGIPAAVIGRINESNDRVLLNEDETRFLEPNRVDEYEKARRFERK